MPVKTIQIIYTMHNNKILTLGSSTLKYFGAGWNDIAYTFLVCEDGRVYEGRGWNVKGSHTLGYNEISIGICLIGDYQTRLPLPAAINATQELLACGVEKVDSITTSEHYNVETIRECWSGTSDNGTGHLTNRKMVDVFAPLERKRLNIPISYNTDHMKDQCSKAQIPRDVS